MYALSVIPTPTGRWVFVGKVPSALAVEASSEEYVTKAAMFGMGIVRKIAEREGGFIRNVSFDTREAALARAAELGFDVANA